MTPEEFWSANTSAKARKFIAHKASAIGVDAARRVFHPRPESVNHPVNDREMGRFDDADIPTAPGSRGR